MNERSHQKQAYISERPSPQGSNVVRVRDLPARAASVIDEYNSTELSHFIGEVVRMGYCVSFTATSDGGAVSVVVFDGYTRIKGYGRSAPHLERSISEVLRIARGEE